MIDRAEDAVIRYGVRWLLIDPWNQVKHKRGKSESEADYQCRADPFAQTLCEIIRLLLVVCSSPD